jgi:hypothetical protein
VSIEIGNRILDNWAMDTSAWCCAYPPHGQIWFCPNPTVNNLIYVLHYRTGAWTQFVPGNDLNFRSCYYNPVDGTMYLGSTEGFLYKYNTSDSGYQDETGGVDTDYTQSIYTKVINIDPYREELIKNPLFTYRSLAAGSATLYLFKEYGNTEEESWPITLSSDFATMSEWSAESMDALAEETMRNTVIVTERMRGHRKNIDNLQLGLVITSGAIEFHNFVIPVASTRNLQ